jgi:glycosyltransferase involved in cell wall biosynthesis
MLNTTLRKANVLLPISLSTMLDLKKKLNIKHDNVFVLPPVIDNRFKPATNECIRNLKTKYSLPDKYFLYVAHTYPHKNHVRLLHAYHRLTKEGFRPWPLVLRADAKMSEAKVRQTIISLNLEKSVIRLPRISTNELSALYSGAGAMIYPSLFEGGGIPVVEAMACGCPIAASTIPAVLETAGNAAFYLDPHSKNSICSSIREIQSNSDLRENLRKKGLEAATNFKDGNIVKTLLLAYKMATKHSSNKGVH